jgi:hypothetical protein
VTAAADPARCAAIMSSGAEPQDYDACRLLARVQNSSKIVPDGFTNYVGTVMRYYVEPLSNLPEMNPDVRCVLSGGTQDLRGSNGTGAYQAKYLALVSTKQLTVPYHIGHDPNFPHSTQSARHSTYWRMLLAHRFLGRPLSNISNVRHLDGPTNLVVEATVTGVPVVSNVTLWATSQSDMDASNWNGFVSYSMTQSAGVYRAAMPTNMVAYYVEVTDNANGLAGDITSAPQPVNRNYPLLRIPPWPVTGFTATANVQLGAINLTWTNPPVNDLAGVLIRCRTNAYPTTALDGVLVYDGTGTAYTHTGLVAGATCYYAAFPYDAVGDYGVAMPAAALAPVQDSDLDGLPDWWELAYFANPTNAVTTNDADGDGQSNWAEYLAGTGPTDKASVFRITWCAVDEVSGDVGLRWASASNRLYTIGWSTNLQAGFSLLTNSLSATPPENGFTDTQPVSTNGMFYRVLTRPP